MKNKHWLVVFGVAVVMVAARRFEPTVSLDYSSSAVSIQSAGYHCSTVNGLTVSRTPMSDDVVAQLGRGRVIQGVVWIETAKSEATTPLPTLPYRVWGNVYAYGDPDLLDEIEAKLR